MITAMNRLVVLCLSACILSGCRAMQNAKPNDAQETPTKRYSEMFGVSQWDWSLPEAKPEFISTALIRRCKKDFRRRSSDHLVFVRGYEDTGKGLVYLIFSVREEKDATLMYAYDKQTDSFRFKCFIPSA
jgi:hypothetical protein